VLTATLGHVSGARADGDPASDVLASQSLFLPADGGFSPAQAAQLSGLLSSAQRNGFPVRLALIATPADLGSVSALWRMPASYAEFLAKELPLVYHGTLLVVMPNGFGVSQVGGTPAGASPGTNGSSPRPIAAWIVEQVANLLSLSPAGWQSAPRGAGCQPASQTSELIR